MPDGQRKGEQLLSLSDEHLFARVWSLHTCHSPCLIGSIATLPLSPPPALQEQVLQLNNERFLVPEVLFSPTDIGLNQAGVPEAVVQAVNATHAALQPLLYTNVILTGEQ